MSAFIVWLRPVGSVCRIRVDGRENARWLLDRLGQLFIFKSSEPVRAEGSTSFCTFLLPCGSQESHSSIARLLAKIPEVTLNMEPALEIDA